MSLNANQELISKILSLPNAFIIMKEVDDLLREERKRRAHFYNEITEFEKAEFINGEVIIHSPVKKRHNDVTALLSRLLGLYISKNKLGYLGIEKIMISLSRNDYEPDICFFNAAKAKDFTANQSLFPAPDLVVEVLSPRTATNDRNIKFNDYQAHQVLEYWMIDPDSQTVEQYRLNDEQVYELIIKASEGHIESKAVEGFRIEIAAIFDDEKNMAEVMRILS